MESNIKNYKKTNILVTYKKNKSPFLITFVRDNTDDWFIDVVHHKKKSGEVTDVSRIIAKDLNNWALWKESLGWEKV